MPMSKKLAAAVAEILVQEVGREKAEKLMDRLVDLVIIEKAPHSPKQSVIAIRNYVLLYLASSFKKGAAGGN